jgi:histidinol-phosphate aminotransferase
MARLVRENSRVKLVFIANPNNPTGTYVTRTEIEAFLKEVRSIRGGSVLVVLDYAYWEYVTAKDLPDPMDLLDAHPNVFVLRTFSKIYGLAGLRVGYGVGQVEVIQSLEKVRQPFNLNALALVGAEAALSDREFVKRSRRVNQTGLKFWETELKKLKIPYWGSQGNFILVDVSRGFGKRGGDVYESCLRRGVIFRPVANYGLIHALRISIGTEAENSIALRALREERPQ